MNDELFEWNLLLEQANTGDVDVEADDFANVDVDQLLSLVAEMKSDELKFETSDCSGESESTEDFLTSVSDVESELTLTNDQGLLEAYLDDAVRCLSSLEKAALQLEADPNERQPVQQFCRELHTLKGASATAGLADLAAELHNVESKLEPSFADLAIAPDVDRMLAVVDRVRRQIETLQAQQAETNPPPQEDVESASATVQPNCKKASSFLTNDESSVRIRAAKLDRLMDMLAELVVLRNRRESHLTEFNQLNEELSRCALRLKYAEEQQYYEIDSAEDSHKVLAELRNGSSTLSEIGKDISTVSLGLRELQKPVSHDNSAISRFIRDFRQELMQLRRVPVSGLFQRLQRAARDAAKSEQKQVRFQIVGEQTGLEQEIQERLYDSLLHVVRNSVSHGIAIPTERIQSGKDPVGILTLQAYSSAQLLVIEVHDDGNGLDYAAVRSRAIEKGLLGPGANPTNHELARLIFHPGFSTRQQASEVSGRGIGMDIVAQTVDQLHGQIEVESVAAQGTTIRLLIPLRSGIEHVMVFRVQEQLFALPLQSVTAAKSANASIGQVVHLPLTNRRSTSETADSQTKDVLLLKHADGLRSGHQQSAHESQKSNQALAIDEIVGPEEVVVRRMPNLLKKHPLCCGMTLSGSGEMVLLLDSDQVIEFCRQHCSGTNSESGSTVASTERVTTEESLRALVVDDSLTARRMLCKFLQDVGWQTVEAGDGIEAIEQLHRASFDLVCTDLDMPRLGGLELISDIKGGHYCDAPVVVVSGRDDETFRNKAMDAGANDFLVKPVLKQSVTEMLNKIQLIPV